MAYTSAAPPLYLIINAVASFTMHWFITVLMKVFAAFVYYYPREYLSLGFDFTLISESFSFLRTQNSSQFASSQPSVSGIIFYSAGTIKGLLGVCVSTSLVSVMS